MSAEQDRDAGDRAGGPVVPMADTRLAQLAAENRRLREALTASRAAALEAAALACAAAEVPSEAGGAWYPGVTDTTTRQACTDAVRRLLHTERDALQAGSPPASADIVRLGG